MSLETIWAPWRLAYVAKDEQEKNKSVAKKDASQPDCFLCRYRDNPQDDAEQLVLLRGETTFVVFNRFPYNNGHMLIAPQQHLGDLTEIPQEVQAECQQML